MFHVPLYLDSLKTIFRLSSWNARYLLCVPFILRLISSNLNVLNLLIIYKLYRAQSLCLECNKKVIQRTNSPHIFLSEYIVLFLRSVRDVPSHALRYWRSTGRKWGTSKPGNNEATHPNVHTNNRKRRHLHKNRGAHRSVHRNWA